MGKEHCNSKLKKNSKKEAQSKGKNTFCIRSSEQSSDCENASQHLIKNIKKERARGNVGPEALRDLTQPIIASQEPALEVLVETDAITKAREDDYLKHKIEHGAHLKMKSVLEENEYNVRANLQKHCAKALKGKLEAQLDFESPARNEQFSLLKHVKESSLSCEEDRHEMTTMTE